MSKQPHPRVDSIIARNLKDDIAALTQRMNEWADEAVSVASEGALPLSAVIYDLSTFAADVRSLNDDVTRAAIKEAYYK